MKKIYFTLYMIATMVLPAVANDLCLTFKATDGSEYSFSVESLSITVRDGKMLIKNSKTKSELAISTLSSMRFTDKEAVKIEEMGTTGAVTVYSLNGVKQGTYNSVQEAEKFLPKSTYIIKQSDKTEKRAIK